MKLGAKEIIFCGVAVLAAPGYASAELLSTSDWWGSIGLAYQNYTDEVQASEIKSQFMADVNGKYYIWQPWFISGKMRVITSADTTSNSGGAERKNTSLGGELSATVLPLSKFPLAMGYSKSENVIAIDNGPASGVSGGGLLQVGQTISATNYYLIQQYLENRYRISLGYDVSENENSITGRYISRKKRFEAVRRDPGSNLNVTVQHQEEEREMQNESRDNRLMLLTHDYQPTERITVATSGSKIDQLDMIDLNGDGIPDEYHNAIDQVVSTLTWRSEDMRTHVNANLRYTGIYTNRLAVDYIDESTTVGIGVRRRINDNINVMGSASHAEVFRNGVSGYNNSYDVSAQYRSDTIMLGEYGYVIGATTGGSVHQTEASEDSRTTVGVDHIISRNWIVGRKGQVRFSADQALTRESNATYDERGFIKNGLRIGYSRTDKDGTVYAQTNLADSRAVSGETEETQQASIQLSRMHKLGMRTSINGNLSHQINRFTNTQQKIESRNSSATISYMHTVNYTFQTLNLSSNLVYNKFESNMAESKDSYSWDNVLKHNIGQLYSSITVRTQNVDDRRSNLILINVTRRF